jgi:hypothetical protein
MGDATKPIFDLMFTGRVTVIERRDDFMAYLDGDTTRWETGSTASEAIAKLVISHSQIVEPTIWVGKVEVGMEVELPNLGWVTVEAVGSVTAGTEVPVPRNELVTIDGAAIKSAQGATLRISADSAALTAGGITSYVPLDMRLPTRPRTSR